MEPQYTEEVIDILMTCLEEATNQFVDFESMPRVNIIDRYETLKAALIEKMNDTICQALSDQDSGQTSNLFFINIALNSLFTAIEKGGKRRVFMSLFYRSQLAALAKEVERLKSIQEQSPS